MSRDLRPPEAIGDALEKLKELYPDMSAPERADLLETFSINIAVSNSNGNGK